MIDSTIPGFNGASALYRPRRQYQNIKSDRKDDALPIAAQLRIGGGGTIPIGGGAGFSEWLCQAACDAAAAACVLSTSGIGYPACAAAQALCLAACLS